jgi:hypothetical protein
MSESKQDPNLKGIECKHVCYTPARDGSKHDLLLVKEVLHYHDGTSKPNLRFFVDFKRPYYIDRAAFAPEGTPGTYKDKKEWQDKNKLQRFTSTQIDLPDSIFRSLNPGRLPSRPQRLREICRSPYIYGADVTTPVIVKHHYIENFQAVNGANGSGLTVACLDTETDMVRGTGEIIMTSVSQDRRHKLVVSEIFVRSVRNPEEEIRKAFNHYLGDYAKKRNIELDIEIVDSAATVVLKSLATLHQWQPDVMAIWNMNFDMKKMIAELKHANIDLGEAFCDPSVPEAFKRFEYIEGSSQKVTQSGKTMPLPYYDQWHTAQFPASFQVIDAMCLYRKLRFTKGVENGYSLDQVLDRNLGIRKLTFKEADHVTKGQWHAFMQQNYPVEYCVYNCFDTISMQELDEETGDICRQLPLHAGHSEFSRFPSQPRRTWDDMEFEVESVRSRAPPPIRCARP